MGIRKPISGPVGVRIGCFGGSSDLDNVIKPTLDAITAAGVWEYDSQIGSLHIERQYTDGGGLRVYIVELDLESMP